MLSNWYVIPCACRCKRTFTNYLNYVRAACLTVGLSDQVFEQKEALRRAKFSIHKKGDHVERPKMWVRLEALTSMACKLITMPELYCCFAMFLTTYAFHLRWHLKFWALWFTLCALSPPFALRLPSECLPIVTGDGECENGSACSGFQILLNFWVGQIWADPKKF